MEYLTIKEISIKNNISERRLTSLCREGRIYGARKKENEWMIPDDATIPKDKRYKCNEEIKEVVNNCTKYSDKDTSKECIDYFYKKYNRMPECTTFTPYRICPLGAHSDHNLGLITGFSIDKGIHMSYGSKQNGIIEIESLQFPKRAQWHVSSVPEREYDWADHLRGATISLSKRYPLSIGLCAVLDGELPIGGLSSSAAVIITFINALASLNHIKLKEEELIEISQEAENKYVGVSCGKLDQSCEIYSKKDSLLFMDLKNNSKETILKPSNMKPFEIAIFFSGLERSLASSKFNMRVDELRSAAYCIKAFSGLEYGKFNETNMGDIPKEIYLNYKDKLPINFKKRAEHFMTEMERVEKGVEAWKNGDIEKFGKLVFESGFSSIHNWETGSPELVKLYEIMTTTKGIYGGRFSGAGFKGCCMALINPDYEKEILETVEREYLKAFPELKDKYSAHICHTADGVKLL